MEVSGRFLALEWMVITQSRKTVFQFHGCLWHGCEKCYPEDRQGLVLQKTRQGKVIPRLDTEKRPMNRKTAYELTLQRTQFLRKEGYRVVEKWEHEKPTPWENTYCPKVETKRTPTQSSTTSSRTKTPARLFVQPVTSFTRVST